MTDERDEDGPVFDPEDLDITDDERVAELDEDRFVISADDDGPNVPEDATDRDTSTETDAPDETAEGSNTESDRDPQYATRPLTGEEVNRWLARSFADNGFRYGFDATLDFEGTVNRHRMVSNDVVTTFETLMLWYVRHVDEETAPEEVLGILLSEADVPVHYPVQSVRSMMDRYDLDPEDSIADLMAAVVDDGGLSFAARPPLSSR